MSISKRKVLCGSMKGGGPPSKEWAEYFQLGHKSASLSLGPYIDPIYNLKKGKRFGGISRSLLCAKKTKCRSLQIAFRVPKSKGVLPY